jgi:hypothetical protein
MIERGYEGFVGKDEASAYEGGPTRRWLKVSRRVGPSRRMAGAGGSSRRTEDDAARPENFLAAVLLLASVGTASYAPWPWPAPAAKGLARVGLA